MIRSNDGWAETGPGTGDAPLLLQALRQRLARAAAEGFDGEGRWCGDAAATRLRTTVLECVADLGHLHQMLCDEAVSARAHEQRMAGPPWWPSDEPLAARLRARTDLAPREASPVPCAGP